MDLAGPRSASWRPCAWRPRAHERVGEPHMNRVETQCWVIPKRPVQSPAGIHGAGMVLYALLAVVAGLIPQGATLLHATVGTWGVAWWATVGVGALHEWYDGVAEGWLSPRLQIAVRFVSWVAIGQLLAPPIRLSANRLLRSDKRVQRSPFDRLGARYHCGGCRRGPGRGTVASAPLVSVPLRELNSAHRGPGHGVPTR